MAAGTCHIGTSGWSYPHWAKGLFYPRGLASGEWLRFYAGEFGTVEVNATYYRLPARKTVERWREVTGPGFRFAVKLWGTVTHRKRLRAAGTEIRSFLAAVQDLGEKRGPLLVQLPPSFRKDAERLDRFLGELARASARSPWRVAVEFRHPDWLDEEVYGILDRHGAAVCLADLPICPITEPNDAPFVYVRRHGPRGRYRGSYPPGRIAADAARIRGWLAAGREVWVYYNNDTEGHAVADARELWAAVAGGDPPQGAISL